MLLINIGGILGLADLRCAKCQAGHERDPQPFTRHALLLIIRALDAALFISLYDT